VTCGPYHVEVKYVSYGQDDRSICMDTQRTDAKENGCEQSCCIKGQPGNIIQKVAEYNY